MAVINNQVKFIILNINIVYFFVGLILLGLAFYVWIAEWGDGLTSSFFLGIGAILFLLAVILIEISMLGSIGVTEQTSKYGKYVDY